MSSTLIKSLLPAAAPLLLMVFAAFLSRLTGHTFPDARAPLGSPPQPPAADRLAAEYRGRVVWQAGSAILLAGMTMLIGYSVWLAVDSRVSLAPYLALLGAICLAAGIFIAVGPLGQVSRAVISDKPWIGMTKPVDLPTWGRVGVAVGFLTPAFLLFAMCVVVRAGLDVAVPTTAPCSDALEQLLSSEASRVASAISQVQGVGLCGAVLLMLGIAVSFLFMSWPSILQPKPVAGAMVDVAATTAFAYGLLLTSLLAGAYVPAAAVLGEHARKFVPPGVAPREWLEQHELAWSTTEQLLAAASVMGPFLAGLASGPIARLFGSKD